MHICYTLIKWSTMIFYLNPWSEILRILIAKKKERNIHRS